MLSKLKGLLCNLFHVANKSKFYKDSYLYPVRYRNAKDVTYGEPGWIVAVVTYLNLYTGEYEVRNTKYIRYDDQMLIDEQKIVAQNVFNSNLWDKLNAH